MPVFLIFQNQQVSPGLQIDVNLAKCMKWKDF